MKISQEALNQIFINARTNTHWLNKPVEDELLHELYNNMKFGPTASNSCPIRILFVKSKEAKEKLLPCMDDGNVEKTWTAPVTAVLAYDLEFYEKLSKLAPHAKDARSWFAGKPAVIEKVAFRNSSLEGGYFIVAARALGLDCGPMSGFSNSKLDETFFSGTSWRSNFICNLGYGDHSKLFPRAPRLDFDEAARII